MTGSVHGGNQPVSGATVTLYSVGQTGAGSSGVALATATTSSAGGFQFQQVATPHQLVPRSSDCLGR